MTQGKSSCTLAFGMLSIALLYVAWRNIQITNEVRVLRSLVDSTVSLHELEEQVMPAIDSLEEEAERLKQEVQTLARQASGAHASGTSHAVKKKAFSAVGFHESDGEWQGSETEDSDKEEARPNMFPGILPKEISLIMGVKEMMGKASSATIGIPTTKVVLKEVRKPTSLVTPIEEMCSDDERAVLESDNSVSFEGEAK